MGFSDDDGLTVPFNGLIHRANEIPGKWKRILTFLLLLSGFRAGFQFSEMRWTHCSGLVLFFWPSPSSQT